MRNCMPAAATVAPSGASMRHGTRTEPWWAAAPSASSKVKPLLTNLS
jgi:hypothetical protein